jgi:hypothetical protein
MFLRDKYEFEKEQDKSWKNIEGAQQGGDKEHHKWLEGHEKKMLENSINA